MSDSDKIKVSWDDIKDPEGGQRVDPAAAGAAAGLCTCTGTGRQGLSASATVWFDCARVPCPCDWPKHAHDPAIHRLGRPDGALIGWAITELVLRDSARRRRRTC